MEKDPGSRYETAAAMAEDLHRWLNGEAILARPGGSVQRLWRWWKRHAAFANLALTAAILLLATSTAIFWQWRRAEMHLVDARRHREQRDAKSAEVASSKREAATSKQQATQATGQILSVAISTMISQDTRNDEQGRKFLRGLLSIPDEVLAQQSDGALPPLKATHAHLYKGDLHRRMGDWDEALPRYTQAIKLLEGVAADAPDDLDLQQKLAYVYQSVGEVQHVLENPSQSLTSYLRARDGRLRLVAAEPEKNNHLLDLANCEIAMGQLYFELQQSDQSKVILVQARRRLRHLQHATSDGQDPQVRSGMRVAYRELGDGLRRIGDTDAALVCYQQADEMGRRQINKFPQDWMAHVELGEVKHQLGEILSAAGKLQQAAAAFQEAASLQRKALKSKILATDARPRLVRHLRAVSIIHRQLGQWQPAIDAIAEVRELVPGDADQVYWSALQFTLCHAALDSSATSQIRCISSLSS
jgi:tetratricopeptide (TPR) repeat protein